MAQCYFMVFERINSVVSHVKMLFTVIPLYAFLFLCCRIMFIYSLVISIHNCVDLSRILLLLNLKFPLPLLAWKVSHTFCQSVVPHSRTESCRPCSRWRCAGSSGAGWQCLGCLATRCPCCRALDTARACRLAPQTCLFISFTSLIPASTFLQAPAPRCC